MSSDECRRASLGHARQMKIGKYLLERTIGKGNSAVVKLATHCDTHQKVRIDEGEQQSTDRPLDLGRDQNHRQVTARSRCAQEART